MIMCLFLFGVALHFSTVARREAFSFFELAGVTANIHSLYTGHGHGMGIHHDTKFGLGKEGMAPRWDVGGGNTPSRGSTRIYLAVCIPRGPRPGLPKIKVQVMTRRRSIWCLRRRVVFGMRREMTKPQKLRARGLPRTGPSRSVVVSPNVGVPLVLSGVTGSRRCGVTVLVPTSRSTELKLILVLKK